MPIYQVDFDRSGKEGSGVRVVTKRGRTWECTSFPRSLLDQVRARYPSDCSGVYLLWGTATKTSIPRLYIGESDEAFTRLKNHLRTETKDFWQDTVVFTTTDRGMHKAHVQHIEAELVKLARQFHRADLMNANLPRPASLHGSDIGEVEEFTADLLDCLAVLGINFFEKSDNRKIDVGTNAGELKNLDSVDAEPTEEVKTPVDAPPLFQIVRKGGRGRWGRDGIKAYGYEKGSKFVVKAGSQAAKTLTKSARTSPEHKHIPKLRNDLINEYKDANGESVERVLEDKGPCFEFMRDFTFDSKSAASCQILGASSNGNKDWKGANERSLTDIRKSKSSRTNVEVSTSEQRSQTDDVSIGTAYDLSLSGKGIEARGRESDDGFWVAQGSRAVKDKDVANNSISNSSRELRTKFISSGTMKEDGNTYVVTKEANFVTASRAAGALLGGSYSGNKYWKKMHLSGH